MNNLNQGKAVGVVMTYNCGHLLEETLHNLPAGVFDEVIISDDGSEDRNMVKDIGEKFGLKVFLHEHGGYGSNLRNGLAKAIELDGEYVVEIHGDGQFDPSISRMAIDKMKQENLDFLIGSRFTKTSSPLRDGMPLVRYLANIGLSFIERVVLRIPWSEYHPGFRVYRRRFVEEFALVWGRGKVASDYLFSFQIIAFASWVKARCGEVPVRANYHKEHTSVGYIRATRNSFQEMGVLSLYILAKLGIKNTIFK